MVGPCVDVWVLERYLQTPILNSKKQVFQKFLVHPLHALLTSYVNTYDPVVHLKFGVFLQISQPKITHDTFYPKLISVSPTLAWSAWGR
jgi:hypothetical protein